MTKDIIMQYLNLKQEIKDIQQRKAEIKRQIEKIRHEGTVLDSVKGTRKDGTFGSIKIEGIPVPKLETKSLKLSEYANALEEKEMKLIELAVEVEKYIDTIGDSRMRRIIRYRVADELSWIAVANKMGGGNTVDSVRMAFNRFLEKN